MKKSLLYLFSFICVQFFATWMVFFAWDLVATGSLPTAIKVFTGEAELPQSGGMIVAAAAVYSVITLFLFLKTRWAEVSSAWISTRQWNVLAWSGVASLGTLLPSIGLQELLPELPDVAEDTFKLIIGNQFGYIVLCLFAPFVEEIVFRGAILKALLHGMNRHWAAIFVSAMLFALVHANPAQMPHAMLIGLLLGWLYYRTGSILPGVALHWVNNTVAYITYKLMPQAEDMTLSQLFGGDNVRILLAMLFSMCILLPAIYQLNGRMKRA